MQFKVSRDDQEYGPYTIEELTQYVSEGSLLPNDYVHNGMEWVPLSEFLKNPHRAATSMHSVSSAANAEPDWAPTSGSRSINFGSIFGGIYWSIFCKFIKWGALSAIVFFGVYYFSTFMLEGGGERPGSSKFSLSGDILYYEGSPYTGTKSQFYPNGKKQAEMYHKNGKRYGISTVWYENGNKMVEANFKDGNQEGRSKVWYDNGQMFEDVVFVNQKPEGDLKVWRKNGDPWIDTKIEEGVPISQKFWNAKGEIVDAESVEGIKVLEEYQKLLLRVSKGTIKYGTRLQNINNN